MVLMNQSVSFSTAFGSYVDVIQRLALYFITGEYMKENLNTARL